MLEKINDWIKKIVFISRELENIKKQNCDQQRQIEDQQRQIEDQQRQIEDQQRQINTVGEIEFQKILGSKSKLQDLSKVLSITYTIWGDSAKLHISELSAVVGAFFNLNSGEIYIGDYTFTGSNVSFLTGSHDMNLTGLLRRDCEIKEGNDIRIGKGVWIASNATILGPCKIGDNAVIAAGSVVLPKTEVQSNSLYAGVPARFIKKIEINEDCSFENHHIKDAFTREGGVLFVKGWKEKQYVEYDNKLYTGHFLTEELGTVFVSDDKKELFYEIEDEDGDVAVNINGTEFLLTERRGYIPINDTVLEIKYDTNRKMFIGV